MSTERKDESINVRLLTLTGCDYCEWLKRELDNEGITYTNIDADMFSDFAESIENHFKTESYPIVFIEYNDNKAITIVSETELETSEILRTFNTIPELIGIIKQYIK